MEKYSFKSKPARRKAIALLLLCLTLSPSLYAEDIPVPSTPAVQKDTPPLAIVQNRESAKSTFSMIMGKSKYLNFTQDISRISLSDPQVLDCVVLSPRELLVNAKMEGSVNMFVWDMLGRISVYDVYVTKDPNLLREIVRRVDPAGEYEVYPSKQNFVIKGKASSVQKLHEIQGAANSFNTGTVLLVNVDNAQQVLLEIRFVKVTRNRDYDFGIDAEYDKDGAKGNSLARFLPGDTNAATSGDTTRTLTTPAQTVDLFDRNDSDIFQFQRFNNKETMQAFVKALESKGLAKIIARPNLLAKDGEEASFLVGGEAAVAVSTNNTVSVQYKEFGTRLTFKPEIFDGKIRLSVEPEVSALDFANGVTIDGITIPSFTSTKAKTVVELEDRQSFMIGGLLQQTVSKTDAGVPYLRRLPLIGKLFQNLSYQTEKSELIILITPKIVGPETRPIDDDQYQTDGLARATRFDKPEYKDKRGDAIDAYIRKNERYLTEKSNRISASQIIEALKSPFAGKSSQNVTGSIPDRISQRQIDAIEPVKPGPIKELNEFKTELQKI